MPTRERNDSGRYVETLTLETVRETVANAPDPIATTKEVADALGCSREAARLKLTQLHDADRIERRNVGSKAIVWWVPDDGSKPARDEGIAAGDVSIPSEVSPAEAGDVPPDSSERIDVDGALSDLALDADRREAVRAMYDYLAEHGTARKSGFTSDVYPEHPAGYGSPGGWWNRLGKDALASLPGIKKPAEGRPTWQFIGTKSTE
jgi:hypothetical protein